MNVYESVLQVEIRTCAEIEVYHNVRHHISEIHTCRKFYMPGREIYFLSLLAIVL